MNGLPDESTLIEIFKKEAADQSCVFEATILALEREPQHSELLDTLMRAAHSMKGAAQIVGLKTISDLAHIIEDCIVRVIKENRVLSSDDFTVLLKAFDEITQVSELSGEAIRQWPGTRLSDIQELEQSVKNIIDGPNEADGILGDGSFLHDETMLGLFHGELGSHLPTLDALKEGKDVNIEEAHVQAVHALKGAAAIVSLDGVVKLLDIMEKEFRVLLEDARSLGSFFSFTKDALEWMELLKGGTPIKIPDIVLINAKKLKSILSSLPSDNEGSKKKIEVEQSAVEMVRSVAQSDEGIKVSLSVVNQITGLAAELLIQARRLDNYKRDMMRLRIYDSSIQQSLDQATHMLGDAPHEQSVKDLLNDSKFKLQRDVGEVRNSLDWLESITTRSRNLSERLYHAASGYSMCSFIEGVSHFPRMVRDLSRKLGKKVSLKIHGGDTLVDRKILERLDMPLNHILRNACDHGIEMPIERMAQSKSDEGLIEMYAYHKSGLLVIEISDDGYGINLELLREKIIASNIYSYEEAMSLNQEQLFSLIFMPGLSTRSEVTEVSGRGFGLDIVHDTLEQEGGAIRINTSQDKGTIFTLQVPISRSVVRALLVSIGRHSFAMPLNSMERVCFVSGREIKKQGNVYKFNLDSEPVYMLPGSTTLATREDVDMQRSRIPVIILSDDKKLYGIAVDSILNEVNLLVRPLEKALGKVPCVSASSVTDAGQAVLLLDIDDIVEIINTSALKKASKHRITKPRGRKESSSKRDILLVDDSYSVREAQQGILKSLGYNIIIAEDGQAAWSHLQVQSFDLIITDLDMPVLNGFDLIRLVRTSVTTEHIPIVVVSSKDSQDDYERAFQLGGNHFFNKNYFVEKDFVKVVKTYLN